MSVLLWIFGSIFLLVFILVKYFQAQAQYWPKRGFTLVGSETTGNILWNVLILKLTGAEIDTKIYKKSKELNKTIVGVMDFNKPALFIRDLDLLKNIYIKDFDSFMDRRDLNMEKSDPIFHRMLIFMESEAWRELRNKMSPTFTTGKIRRMFEIFHSSSLKLVKYAENSSTENNGVVNFSDGYQRYAMDVIASAAFGVDSKTFVENDPIFQQMGKKMQLHITLKMLVAMIIMAASPKLGKALGLSLFEDKNANAFFTQVIMSAIKHREESGEKRDDFLQLMLEARNGQLKIDDVADLSTFEKEARLKDTSTKQDKVILTDDIILAQSILFILAGFDTTQSLLLFSIYELALCPGVQEKLANEVRKAKNKFGGKFTYESINECEYLDKVISETLRKYPPVPRLERKTMVDFKIPNSELVIPKDTLVCIPAYAIHHEENYYPDPEVFDPERFSSEEKNKRHPMAYQPFGHGPRNCIGMRFALTNVKMAIANLVDNFVFEPSTKTTIPVKFANTTTLQPKDEIFLKATPRSTN